MRRRVALGVGLLTWLLAGCAGGPSVPDWLAHARPKTTAPARNIVLLEVALLECPLGDRYINNDLWDLADEFAVGADHQAAVEDNGFRVAQIGGIIPDELQELLTSKRSNVNPRQRQVLPGHSAPVQLGPTVSSLHFTMLQDGEPITTNLDQAQGRLQVLPTFTADGNIRLHFTPEVEHGEPISTYHPAPDGSGWMMQVERARQTYADLAWEVTLAPRQYLVIGARFDQPQSLGYACFVQADPISPVQRLLVIRARDPAGPAPDDEVEEEGVAPVCARRVPVLAEQAQKSCTTARGRAP
jgi:hypothetical protein